MRQFRPIEPAKPSVKPRVIAKPVITTDADMAARLKSSNAAMDRAYPEAAALRDRLEKNSSEPATKRRGPKPSGNAKELVSLRLSGDVLTKFRATGKGWQARIDEALRKATP